MKLVELSECIVLHLLSMGLCIDLCREICEYLRQKLILILAKIENYHFCKALKHGSFARETAKYSGKKLQ